ncbi:hypothetical protein VYU27_007502 [Nannochloropsis oceanica]
MNSPEVLAEALSAAEGGAISTAVLYPLEVIKTVIQASKGKKKAETKPSAASSSTWNEEQARAEEGEASPIAAAAAATVTAITLASGSAAEKERKGGEDAAKPLTSREVAQDIYKRAGVTGFFGGVQYASLQSALEKSIYFYAYSTMKGITKLLNGGRFGVRENLIVGYLSEVIHLPVTVPLEVIITRIITSQGRVSSWAQATKELLEENGVKGLYKGITTYGVLCLKPAIQYTVFEQLRRGIISFLSRRQGGALEGGREGGREIHT